MNTSSPKSHRLIALMGCSEQKGAESDGNGRTIEPMWANQFWWMISFLALAALLALLFFIVIPAHGSALYFGHPMSCPVPGHGGPPCNMEKCKALDKDGKKTGSNCSKYCAKACCLCTDACPKEQNQNSPNDEENLAYQFGG